MSVTVTPESPKRLNDAERQAVIAAVSSGRSQTIVAQDFGVSKMCVSRIMRTVKAVTQQVYGDWRTHQTHKAVAAVDAGLDHADDPYKRADLGVKVLTGLQVYKPAESSSVTNVFVASISDLPQDWQQRMRRVIDPHAPALPAETED